MGSSIKVDVVMSPTFEQDVMKLPKVKSAVTKEANAIADRANGLATEKSGIWHDTGKPHNPDRTGGTWHDHGDSYPKIGGTEPAYKAKPAKMIGNKPFAIAYTGNYAAQKDNLNNNTLLKAKG